MFYDPVNPISIFVVAVEAEFVLDPEENEERAGYPDGQSGNVDNRIDLLLTQDAESDRQVAFEHNSIKLRAIIMPSFNSGTVYIF